jgi:hypothetical protein
MLERRPPVALILAMIALCLALGGGAVAADPTKPRVTKVAKKVAKKQIKKRAILKRDEAGLDVNSAVSAGDATTLGGVPEAAFQREGDLLSAVIDPANVDAAVVGGRGIVAVERLATGWYELTFDRNISDCSAQATAGNRLSEQGAPAAWATVRGPQAGQPPTEMGVVLHNADGAHTDSAFAGFHVLVLCP